MKLLQFIYVAAFAALCCAAPVHALERVASTPYNGSSNLNGGDSLNLPACNAGQVLTSLGSNTFTCIDVNSSTTSTNSSGTDTLGLPTCGADQGLAVTAGKFVCGDVVKNAPKCEEGYALVGDGKQTLSCVKMVNEPPACAAGQVLTSDQGQFTCVTLKTPPTCAAGQVLSASGGNFTCTSVTVGNCNGRVIQNWGGVQYCATLSCGAGQVLSMSDGYMQCVSGGDNYTLNRVLACQSQQMYYDPNSSYATPEGCVRNCSDYPMNGFAITLYCAGGPVKTMSVKNATVCAEECLKTPGVSCCGWNVANVCSIGTNGAFTHPLGMANGAGNFLAMNCRSGGK